MKNTSFFFAATMIFLFGFQVSLSAQKPTTWKGGTPGRSADWNCPTNWKEGRVPNEFSDVTIPDVSTGSGIQPIVRCKAGSVNSLTLLSGAQLHIENSGSLEVTLFVEIIGIGNIENNGILSLPKKSDGDLAKKL